MKYIITIITTDEETKQYDSSLSAFGESQQLSYIVIEIIPFNNQTHAVVEERERNGTTSIPQPHIHPERRGLKTLIVMGAEFPFRRILEEDAVIL